MFMKKVLILVLTIVMVINMAIPAFALEGAHAEWERLLPILSGDSDLVILYNMKDVEDLTEETQAIMDEAAEKLDEARPDHLALKYFCWVETVGSEDACSIVLEWIEHDNMEIKQYVDGEWKLIEHTVDGKRKITVDGVVNAPLAIFINDVYGMAGEDGSSPSGGRPSVTAKKQKLLPSVSRESTLLVLLHSTEMIPLMSEEIQAQMAEAKAKLKDACPHDCAAKFFCYVEVIGESDSASVVFEKMDFEEIHFNQYVNGEWVELSYVINEDGTITVENVVTGPKVIFIK